MLYVRGQMHDEFTACVRPLAPHFDGSAVQFDKLFGHREADAETGGNAYELERTVYLREWFEHPIGQVSRNADAVVFDPQDYPAALARERKFDQPPLRRVLCGIDEQVKYFMLDSCRIAHHHHHFALRDGGAECMATALHRGADTINRMFDQPLHVHHFFLQDELILGYA